MCGGGGSFKKWVMDEYNNVVGGSRSEGIGGGSRHRPVWKGGSNKNGPEKEE